MNQLNDDCTVQWKKKEKDTVIFLLQKKKKLEKEDKVLVQKMGRNG